MTLIQKYVRDEKIVPAALTGLLLTASFPEAGFSGLACVALVPLLAAVEGASPGKSFRVGFMAGLIHFLSLLYWVVHSMQVYGNLGPAVSAAILFLLAAYLACYPGLFAMLAASLPKNRFSGLFLIPAFWVACEYARFRVMAGFPWEFLGCSQYQNLAFIQIADLFGVYGVSFWIVFSNACVWMIFGFFSFKNARAKTISRARAAGALGLLFAASAAVFSYGKWRMISVDALMASAPKKTVAFVQGNIPQEKKWDPNFSSQIIQKYLDLSLSVQDREPDLVVWPETATPFYFLQERRRTPKLLAGLAGMDADFVIGSPQGRRTAAGVEYLNSAYLLSGKGKVFGRYDKSRLVPYGEYIPLKRFMPFLGKIVAQAGDFVPGPVGRTLEWKESRVGIQICYEIIFPDISRLMAQNGAGLLINITNDAWFGKTSAARQHFSMAVLRAVENRRAVVRAANTGISAFIDPVGRITGETGLFKEAAIAAAMPVYEGETFYTRRGDLFALACVFVSLFFVLMKRLRRAIKGAESENKRKKESRRRQNVHGTQTGP